MIKTSRFLRNIAMGMILYICTLFIYACTLLTFIVCAFDYGDDTAIEKIIGALLSFPLSFNYSFILAIIVNGIFWTLIAYLLHWGIQLLMHNWRKVE